MAIGPPYLPGRDVKVERAIGRFIIAWGALEREIDRAIHDLMLTGLSTGALVTANMAIRAKLELAHALFEKMRAGENPIWRPISADWEARFDRLVNATARANTEARIPIVHSQPMVLKLDGGDEAFFVRMAARKGGLRGFGIIYNKAFLDEQTAAVVGLVHEWSDARNHWHSAVSAMRSSDADEWLSRTPDEQDHLILHVHSSRSSPNANPTPSRQKKPSRRAKREAREALK